MLDNLILHPTISTTLSDLEYPKITEDIIDSFPPALTEIDKFCVCKYVPIPETGKIDKIPVKRVNDNFFINGNAAEKDTQCSIKEAIRLIGLAEKAHPSTHFGLGFYIDPVDKIGFLDFDKSFRPDGVLKDLPTDIMNSVPGWAERSVSKKGLHLIFKYDGECPSIFSNEVEGLELYHKSRFIALTGDVYDYPLFDSSLPEFKDIHLVVSKYIKVQDSKPKSVCTGYMDPTPDELRIILNYISSDDEGTFFTISVAVTLLCLYKEDLEEDYKSVWQDWCEKGKNYDEKKNDKKWERFKANAYKAEDPLTIATVIGMAKENGYDDKSSTEEDFEVIEKQKRLSTATSTLVDGRAPMPKWIWRNYFPKESFAIIAADPSAGKTTLAFKIASHVISGKPWPDGTPCEKGKVVYLTQEDPFWHGKMLAHGIDPDDLLVIAMDDDPLILDEKSEVFQDLIEEFIEEGVAMIILDPLNDFLGLKDVKDFNNNMAMRKPLNAFGKMCAKAKCAGIGIMHNTKANNGDAWKRVQGSIASVAVARAVFSISSHSEMPSSRFLYPTKINVGDRSKVHTWEVQATNITIPADQVQQVNGKDVPEEERIVQKLDWVGTSDFTETEFHADSMAKSRGEKVEKLSKGEIAEEWAIGYLKKNGETPAKELEDEMKKAGKNWRSFQEYIRSQDGHGPVQRKRGQNRITVYFLDDADFDV